MKRDMNTLGLSVYMGQVLQPGSHMASPYHCKGSIEEVRQSGPLAGRAFISSPLSHFGQECLTLHIASN